MTNRLYTKARAPVGCYRVNTPTTSSSFHRSSSPVGFCALPPFQSLFLEHTKALMPLFFHGTAGPHSHKHLMPSVLVTCYLWWIRVVCHWDYSVHFPVTNAIQYLSMYSFPLLWCFCLCVSFYNNRLVFVVLYSLSYYLWDFFSWESKGCHWRAWTLTFAAGLLPATEDGGLNWRAWN